MNESVFGPSKFQTPKRKNMFKKTLEDYPDDLSDYKFSTTLKLQSNPMIEDEMQLPDPENDTPAKSKRKYDQEKEFEDSGAEFNEI